MATEEKDNKPMEATSEEQQARMAAAVAKFGAQ